MELQTESEGGCENAVAYSVAGSAADAAAAPAASVGGGSRVGTEPPDLEGVDVGETLLVGDPCNVIEKRGYDLVGYAIIFIQSYFFLKKLTFVGDLTEKERKESCSVFDFISTV